MTGKNDRRCYRREQLRLPVQISWNQERRAPVPAWMLDASPGGLLLELPEPIRIPEENPLNLSLLSGENSCYKLGAGIIRHRESSPEDGGQILGVQLNRENPLLFCASMLGASPGMMEIKSLLPQIAASNLNILIRGETGAGKNVLAKTIHDVCRGPEQPFIRVNCPSIPDTLFESELFGHEKGAFTDAKSSTRLFPTGGWGHHPARRNLRNPAALAGQAAARH